MSVPLRNPRLLFLSRDPALVEAQLKSQRLTLAQAGPLRDDISTDEITPLTVMTVFDERLGRYAHTGFKTGGAKPIAVDALKSGNFSVLVGGKRYGKGSSREHSPVAEREAGVQLVIAESFERIYRQNADNVGLFTSTDFGLIERLQAGDVISVDELVGGRDRLAAAILRAGGLLQYGKAALSIPNENARRSATDAALPGTTDIAPKPQTLAQKIFQRNALATAQTPAELKAGEGGFVRADWRFIHEYYTGMAAHLLQRAYGDTLALHKPQSILAFEDHLSYAHRSPAHVTGRLLPGVRELSGAHRRFVAAHGIKDHCYLDTPSTELAVGAIGGSEGISHALMAERYALPGQLVVGTDSHTPHSGAVGCLAFGVGTTDMANSMVTGAVRVTMPESLRIELNGLLPPGVTAKDLVLHLLALPDIKAGAGVGRIFEFTGSAVRALSTDERATLTNMTAELGGFTGIVAPDAESARFLKERRGVDFSPEAWMVSDAGAPYAGEITVDCSALTPMVARPGDPGNGIALCTLASDTPVKLDIAYGGSCTAGKRADFDLYHEVLAWAVAHGQRVAPHVKLYLQFGTVDVRDYCERQGYLATFAAAGAELLQPACGACANCGPGSSDNANQVTVSAINRNFPGRSGPGNVWLASPPTVAASAIAGWLCSFAELQSAFSEAKKSRSSSGFFIPGPDEP